MMMFFGKSGGSSAGGYDISFEGAGIPGMTATDTPIGTITHNVPGGVLTVADDSNFRFGAVGANVVAGKCPVRNELLGGTILYPKFKVTAADGSVEITRRVAIPVLAGFGAPGAITLAGPYGVGSPVVPRNAPEGTVVGKIIGRVHPESRLTATATHGGRLDVDQYGYVRAGATASGPTATLSITVREQFAGNEQSTVFNIPVADVVAPSSLAWNDDAPLVRAISTQRGPINVVRTLTWDCIGPVEVTLDNGLDCGYKIMLDDVAGVPTGLLFPYAVMEVGAYTLTARVKSLITGDSTTIDLDIQNEAFDLASIAAVKGRVTPGLGVTTGSRIIPTGLTSPSGVTLTMENRTGASAANPGYCHSVLPIAGGQLVFFAIYVMAGQTATQVGLKDGSYLAAGHAASDWGSDTHGLRWTNDGKVRFNGSDVLSGLTWTAGDWLYFAVDKSANTVRVAVNATSLSAAISLSGMDADTYTAAQLSSFFGKVHFNFGQKPFQHQQPPMGYRAGIGVNDPDAETIAKEVIDQISGVTLTQTMGPLVTTALDNNGNSRPVFRFKPGQRLSARGSNALTAVGTRSNTTPNGKGADEASVMMIVKAKRSTPGSFVRTEIELIGSIPSDVNLEVKMNSSGVVQVGSGSANLNTIPDDTWCQVLVELNRVASPNQRGRHDGLSPSTVVGNSTASGSSLLQNLLTIGTAEGVTSGAEFLLADAIFLTGALSDDDIGALRSFQWNAFNTPLQGSEDFSSGGPNCIDLRDYLFDERRSDNFDGPKLSIANPRTGVNGKWIPTMPEGQDGVEGGTGGMQINRLYSSWDSDPRSPDVAAVLDNNHLAPGIGLVQIARRCYAEDYDFIGGDGGIDGFPSTPGVSKYGGAYPYPRWIGWIGSMLQMQRRSQDYGYVENCFKLDKEKGTWPALWRLFIGGAWPPEFDIRELFSNLNGYRLDSAIHSTLRPGGTTRVGDVVFSPIASSDPETQQMSFWQEYDFSVDGGTWVVIGGRFDPDFGLGIYINSVFVGFVKDLPEDMHVPSYTLLNMDTFAAGAFGPAPDASTPDRVRQFSKWVHSYWPKPPTYSVGGGTDEDVDDYIAALPDTPSGGDQAKLQDAVKASKLAIGLDMRVPDLSLWELRDLILIYKFGLLALKGGVTASGLAFSPGVGIVGAAGNVCDTGYIPYGKGAGHADIIDELSDIWIDSVPASANGRVWGLGNRTSPTAYAAGATGFFLNSAAKTVGVWSNNARTDRSATRADAAGPDVGNGGHYGWARYPARFPIGSAPQDNVNYYGKDTIGRGHRRNVNEYVAGATLKALDDCQGVVASFQSFGRRMSMQAYAEWHDIWAEVLS